MTAQQLAALVRSKRLGPQDWVRKDDSKWVPAAKVKGLFPSEGASASPPPPAAGEAPASGVTTIVRHEVTADWVPGSSGGSDTGWSASGSSGAGAKPSGGRPGEEGSAQGSGSGNAVQLSPGSALGNYRILETLGEGGMGVVLKAQHIRMERLVALKVLRGQATESPAAIKRFQQEVRAAARLSHPNIVTAFDADDVQGVHFLVMEYVNGQNLADYLAERGRLEIPEAINYVLQTAKGLEYAHGEGVVHRDIKPGNLLLDKRGVVKILDMGLASIREPRESTEGVVHADVTQANQLLGTFDYMPPEQAEDPRSVDHRADIYSLGCTLYRLLTGQLPFRGDSPLKKILAHRDQPIPSIRDLRPEVPAEVERVYKKMLAKNPDERYPSMGEVVTALQGALEKKEPSVGLQGGSRFVSSGSSKSLPGDDDYQLSSSDAPRLRGGGEAVVVPAGGVADDDDDDMGGFQLAPMDGVSEERWYWQCMGQEAGPFTLRQLRSKKLTPDDLVRRENGRKWMRAAEIFGLF